MTGYIEWISKDPDMRVGFITNCFGRLLYINNDWPDGKYVKWDKSDIKLANLINVRENCKRGRDFTKAELMIELL